ncbi:hypothetical protein FHS95_003479 [Sphingomonas naasensis]|uniref:Uncharacterized protein n=1 Tax=Sphingomonas naasensis TaxID=1344951 RepID=A0A4S1WN14_9SPHN|nr:hypothetical protein [Sphingomonas naasensis]NIJ21768.1 hypothetical protein [Sphingomonas naasensis]TGX42526.1 hypothetical protein E5A74_11875 [Sphingomonas naasensis]
MGIASFALALAAALQTTPGVPQAAPGPRPAMPAPVPPACRRVGEAAFLRIDAQAAARLAEIGLDRAAIFERMAETSIPETMGCWAMPVGNFDSQLISVGMSQWNYGTGSLQPVLKAWKKALGGKFGRTRKALAPVYGKLLFSRDCLKVPVRDKCRAGILTAHGADGRLNPTMLAELTAIFESDAMLQVQTDAYVALLMAVRADLLRVFAGQPITMRKVRWAIDTKVQQGFFPIDEDLARLRTKLAAMPEAERWDRLRAIFAWYEALSRTIDQDGVARDWAWNVAQWRCMIDRGRIDAEQYEMLHLTFLRSRTAVGNSGRWQALTFSRRGKIILGIGSVSGKRDGDCLGGG